MSDEPKLEEQAISEAAAMTISTQLDEVENLDVDIKTNLLKIVQGQAESVSVVGQGLVMQKDIRVQEMELHTDRIAINPLSALFGQIELNKPVGATARIVLTEQDLNRALNSEYIRSKFPNLQLVVEDQIVTLDPEKLEIFLGTANKMTIKGTVLLNKNATSRTINFIAVVCLPTSQTLLLEAFHCAEGDGITLEFAIALMQKAQELLNSPYIDLDGMALRVKSMEVQEGSLTLYTEAYVRQLPDLNGESAKS
jgi:LmeA-like phospholipid-binding